MYGMHQDNNNNVVVEDKADDKKKSTTTYLNNNNVEITDVQKVEMSDNYKKHLDFQDKVRRHAKNPKKRIEREIPMCDVFLVWGCGQDEGWGNMIAEYDFKTLKGDYSTKHDDLYVYSTQLNTNIFRRS